MIGLAFLAVVLAVETLVFSAPARIPAIKRHAMSSRVWRWGAIVLLASLPTLIHIFGLLWITPTLETYFADIGYMVHYELRDDVITELRWRTFIAWDNERCFTGNVEVCDAVDKWRAVEAERAAYQQEYDKSSSDWVTGLFGFGLLLSPSFCVGYAVYRITHDIRKQKYS